MTTDAQKPDRIWAFEGYPGQGAVPRSGAWCDEQSECPDGSPCYVRADLRALKGGDATPAAQEAEPVEGELDEAWKSGFNAGFGEAMLTAHPARSKSPLGRRNRKAVQHDPDQ